MTSSIERRNSVQPRIEQYQPHPILQAAKGEISQIDQLLGPSRPKPSKTKSVDCTTAAERRARLKHAETLPSSFNFVPQPRSAQYEPCELLQTKSSDGLSDFESFLQEKSLEKTDDQNAQTVEDIQLNMEVVKDIKQTRKHFCHIC